MRGFAILLPSNLLGLRLHAIGVLLPANVLGLICFTAALLVGAVRVKWVQDAASFLLRHLMLFFIENPNHSLSPHPKSRIHDPK